MSDSVKRPGGVTVIVVVNVLAAIITLAFWALVYLRLFGPQAEPGLDHATIASTFGFMIADLIWAVPLLIISIPGVWKMRFWGWTAAQMANILWFYTLTALWARDRAAGAFSPGILIFLPFALFSVWAVIYLWKQHTRFYERENRA